MNVGFNFCHKKGFNGPVRGVLEPHVSRYVPKTPCRVCGQLLDSTSITGPEHWSAQELNPNPPHGGFYLWLISRLKSITTVAALWHHFHFFIFFFFFHTRHVGTGAKSPRSTSELATTRHGLRERSSARDVAEGREGKGREMLTGGFRRPRAGARVSARQTSFSPSGSLLILAREQPLRRVGPRSRPWLDRVRFLLTCRPHVRPELCT